MGIGLAAMLYVWWKVGPDYIIIKSIDLMLFRQPKFGRYIGVRRVKNEYDNYIAIGLHYVEIVKRL